MRHKLPWPTRTSAAAAAFGMRSEPALNAMNMCSACRSEHICVPLCGICHGPDGDRCVCTPVSTRVVERCPVTLWDLSMDWGCASDSETCELCCGLRGHARLQIVELQAAGRLRRAAPDAARRPLPARAAAQAAASRRGRGTVECAPVNLENLSNIPRTSTSNYKPLRCLPIVR